MNPSCYRKATNGLLRYAQKIGHPDRAPWIRAMAAETRSIKSDFGALEFALGSFIAITKETLRMQRFEPVVRWFLVCSSLAWAAGKIYLVVALWEKSVATPLWLTAILALAAVVYAASAFSLLTKKYLLFCVFLVLALATNSALFGFAQFQFLLVDFQPAESLTWYFAVISEEYFMWTAMLFGALVILALKNFDRAKAALLPSMS